MNMARVFLIVTSVALALTDLPGAKAALELNCDDYPKMPDCPRRYVPLCGTNGKDYLNACHLCRHNLKTGEAIRISHEGFCTCDDL